MSKVRNLISSDRREFEGYANSRGYEDFLNTDCLVDPQVFIELTSTCNFKCSYCFSPDSQRVEIMTDELFYTILGQLHGFSKQPIRLHCDGEPTLHKKFVEYATAINKKGMRVALATNGSTLCKKYLSLRVDMKIHLSTSPEELEDRYTVNFERYISTIQQYLKDWTVHNCDQSINLCIYLSDQQRKSPEELERIQRFLVSFLNETGFDTRETNQLLPSSTWFTFINCRNRTLQVQVSNIASGGLYPETEAPKKVTQDRSFGFCDSPWKRMVILASGRIQACCLDLFGNLAYSNEGEITESNLVELWRDDARIQKIREKMLSGLIDHPTCRQCLDRVADREIYITPGYYEFKL